MKVAILSVVLGACSPWVDADTKSATDAIRLQLTIEDMCSDAGECMPSRVRALERASYCANASMLFRHGQAVPDGGTIQCEPKQ